MKLVKSLGILACALSAPLLISGCSSTMSNYDGTYMSAIPPAYDRASLSKRTATYVDLLSMPKPVGPIITSVYSFRDQTGQYKPAPSSSISTAVSQGATSMLIEALSDSGWFIPLEREGLQNLLTERKIIRASEGEGKQVKVAPMLSAKVMMEGGIIAYESNMQTGGAGARFLGIGGSEQYRVDQVTVSLRAINVTTGEVLNSVSTSKSILSKEVQTGVFRYIDFKELLELDSGVTTNEPAQLALRAAIEAAVIHMVIDGLEDKHWQLANAGDIAHPILQRYSSERPEVMAMKKPTSILERPSAEPRRTLEPSQQRRSYNQPNWWLSSAPATTTGNGFARVSSDRIAQVLPPLERSAPATELSYKQVNQLAQSATENTVKLDAMKASFKLAKPVNAQPFVIAQNQKSAQNMPEMSEAEKKQRLEEISRLEQKVRSEEAQREMMREKVLASLQERWQQLGVKLVN